MKDDALAAEDLEAIRSELLRLESLVQDVLLMGKDAPVDMRRVLVYTILKSVVALMAPQARSAGVHLTIDDPTDTEIEIECDLNQIKQVLINLIKNAIESIEEHGSVTLRSYGKIVSGKKWAFIDVEDTGKGIPRKDFKTIFKPGYSTRERGWGLGLSLSKRIIEEYHGGRIFVLRSDPGNGCTMRVILNK